jgi:hypothetical protein
MLKDDNPFLEKILKGDKPSLMEILKCNKSFFKFFTGKKPLHKEIERGFMQRIIAKVQVVEHIHSPPNAERNVTTQGFIHDAWKLAIRLLDIGDEHKMWEVIEGVWVEMLCFSARCRGYLHAKSLGTGGEFFFLKRGTGGELLAYIWLLLSHMGMETLPERLQRTELTSGEAYVGATPSTSQVSTATREALLFFLKDDHGDQIYSSFQSWLHICLSFMLFVHCVCCLLMWFSM